jgi:hypothetical protein
VDVDRLAAPRFVWRLIPLLSLIALGSLLRDVLHDRPAESNVSDSTVSSLSHDPNRGDAHATPASECLSRTGVLDELDGSTAPADGVLIAIEAMGHPRNLAGRTQRRPGMVMLRRTEASVAPGLVEGHPNRGRIRCHRSRLA